MEEASLLILTFLGMLYVVTTFGIYLKNRTLYLEAAELEAKLADHKPRDIEQAWEIRSGYHEVVSAIFDQKVVRPENKSAEKKYVQKDSAEPARSAISTSASIRSVPMNSSIIEEKMKIHRENLSSFSFEAEDLLIEDLFYELDSDLNVSVIDDQNVIDI